MEWDTQLCARRYLVHRLFLTAKSVALHPALKTEKQQMGHRQVIANNWAFPLHNSDTQRRSRGANYCRRQPQ